MIIGLSYLDWVFLSTIFISVIIGAYRGWLPQALSMLGFFAAFVAFVKLGPTIAQWLPLSGPGESLRENLGALIALQEHRVFVSGAVWGINSFDQWGVELGKQLAQKISQQIAQGAPSSDQDASTSQLLHWYLKHQ